MMPSERSDLTAFEEAVLASEADLEQYRQFKQSRRQAGYSQREIRAEYAGRHGWPYRGKHEDERRRYRHGRTVGRCQQLPG
jgi:hypothetical protein